MILRLRTVLTVSALLLPTAVLGAAQPATAPSLQGLIEGIRLAGHPTRAADLHPSPLGDDQNAAILLRQAGEKLDRDHSGVRNSAMDMPREIPYPPAWHREVTISDELNGEVFRLVRKARGIGTLQWNDRPTSPIMEWVRKGQPGFNPLRATANALADSALASHFSGDDLQAIERLNDLLFIADATSQRPFLISNLVATGIRAIACEPAMVIAADLKPASDATAAQAIGAARQAIGHFIAELLNDKRLRDDYARVIRQERVLIIDHLQGKDGLVLAAAWHDKLPVLFASYDALADAAFLPLHKQPIIPREQDPMGTARSFALARQTLEKLILGRRMAAVSLAAALYRNDTGDYPKAFAELVPKYLPAVPVDPYSREEAPLLYRRAFGGKRPMTGSVGPDALDAGLRDEDLPPVMTFSPNRPEPGTDDDIWLDLSAWR